MAQRTFLSASSFEEMVWQHRDGFVKHHLLSFLNAQERINVRSTNKTLKSCFPKVMFQYFNRRDFFYEVSCRFDSLNGRVEISKEEITDGGYSNQFITLASIQDQLNSVTCVEANSVSFCALNSDGTVVTWGDKNYGGEVNSQIADQLHDVTSVFHNDDAFAALRSDGSVVTWGDDGCGGDSSNVETELQNVKTIVSTGNSFAALKNDGTVTTWGNRENGGDSSSVKDQLQNVDTISSTDWAYAALRTDGSIVCWGHSLVVECFNAVASELQSNVIRVEAVDVEEFRATKNDGTQIIW